MEGQYIEEESEKCSYNNIIIKIYIILTTFQEYDLCQFLSPEQAAMVRDCSPHQKWSLLGARGFSVLPFDSRFRYLFLMQERNQ